MDKTTEWEMQKHKLKGMEKMIFILEDIHKELKEIKKVMMPFVDIGELEELKKMKEGVYIDKTRANENLR